MFLMCHHVAITPSPKRGVCYETQFSRIGYFPFSPAVSPPRSPYPCDRGSPSDSVVSTEARASKYTFCDSNTESTTSSDTVSMCCEQGGAVIPRDVFSTTLCTSDIVCVILTSYFSDSDDSSKRKTSVCLQSYHHGTTRAHRAGCFSTYRIYLKEWGAWTRGLPRALNSRPPASLRKEGPVVPSSAQILDPNRISSTSWCPSEETAGERLLYPAMTEWPLPLWSCSGCNLSCGPANPTVDRRVQQTTRV